MLVKIKQGLLKGRSDTSLTSGRVFYSFLGIPYAEPPIGELRFRPPVPANGWSGTRDASYDRDRCIQLVVPEPKDPPSNESEDCLYINVFTPEPPNPKAPLKPVMVYLHGGGYYVGAGSMNVCSPDHLADYDVVLVSFNYRLHIFGFLNLNTSSSTGNCGCKDMVLALQWVKENIQNFGGDPKNVTICGISAGGVSTHLLTISPLATGLFHKAIVESGTVIGPCIVKDQVEAGFQLGRKLGFTGTDAEDLVKFLRKQPADVLTKEARLLVVTQKADRPFSMSGFKIFVPSIEMCSDNAFLPDYPINLISSSQTVPMITGVAEKEGVIVLFGLESYENFFVHLKYSLADLVKANVPCDPLKVIEITKKVKEHYLDSLGEDATDEEIREKFVEIYSHLFFRNLYVLPEKTTKLRAPLYVYQFRYVGGLNNVTPWSNSFAGALHATQAGYITLSRGLYPEGVRASKQDRSVVKNLCTAWTNFARTSNPNPLPDSDDVQWNPHSPEDPSYMLFDEKCTSTKGMIWNEGLEFWNQIYSQYGDWSADNKWLQL